ncbi:MAG: helical backbone metal receptor, partial [Ginsengibacter sp.]
MIISGNVIPEKKYSRIISLVPSLTELLFDLGLEEEVIGITKFCVHPNNWFRTKTRIGGTKDIHFEKIFALAPDLIIANKEENIKEQIEELAKKYDVLVTDINDLQQAEDAINTIGLFTQKSETAN